MHSHPGKSSITFCHPSETHCSGRASRFQIDTGGRVIHSCVCLTPTNPQPPSDKPSVRFTMSALLDVPARTMNLNAEYGYSARSFNKCPYVRQASSYASVLMFVYRQEAPIPHRMYPYRNHYTLYASADTVMVCRTATTMTYDDENDAVLLYDVFRPTKGGRDSFRASTGSWVVSFDRIEYSSVRPNLAGFELLSHGEWYYFDGGIVLVGVSNANHGEKCYSTLMYYELHSHYQVMPGSTIDSGRFNIMVADGPIDFHPDAISSSSIRPPQPPPPQSQQLQVAQRQPQQQQPQSAQAPFQFQAQSAAQSVQPPSMQQQQQQPQTQQQPTQQQQTPLTQPQPQPLVFQQHVMQQHMFVQAQPQQQQQMQPPLMPPFFQQQLQQQQQQQQPPPPLTPFFQQQQQQPHPQQQQQPPPCQHSSDYSCPNCWQPSAQWPIQFQIGDSVPGPLGSLNRPQQPPAANQFSQLGMVPISTYTGMTSSTMQTIPATQQQQLPMLPRLNDSVRPAPVRIKFVLPSTYWFHQRALELLTSDISYFLPRS
jgi:hypothetical protein